MKNRCCYKMPIGTICMEEEDGKITSVFLKEKSVEDSTEYETELLKNAHRQLVQYFKRERKEFDLPVRMAGTDFQNSVWEALRTIPYGETRSYGQMAQMIGNPGASRAVGGANNKNPILILIPCHRVIGADGSLVGFGTGLEIKKFLLELEKKDD